MAHEKEMAEIRAQYDADKVDNNKGASDKVQADLNTLEDQITALKNVRKDDKKAFGEALRKEELTLRALKKAIQILRHFYGGANKGATFLQTHGEDDPVDYA